MDIARAFVWDNPQGIGAFGHLFSLGVPIFYFKPAEAGKTPEKLNLPTPATVTSTG